MNCPNCKQVLPASETRTEHLSLPEGQLFGNRVLRFAECPCGTFSTLQSWQGWDRWYITRFTSHPVKVGKGSIGERGPDYDAYYERINNGEAS